MESSPGEEVSFSGWRGGLFSHSGTFSAPPRPARQTKSHLYICSAHVGIAQYMHTLWAITSFPLEARSMAQQLFIEFYLKHPMVLYSAKACFHHWFVVCLCCRNFLTLQQSPVTKQWQEKPLCLSNGGSCRGYFSGHILGFGEDELGTVQTTSIKYHPHSLAQEALFWSEWMSPSHPLCVGNVTYRKMTCRDLRWSLHILFQ